MLHVGGGAAVARGQLSRATVGALGAGTLGALTARALGGAPDLVTVALVAVVVLGTYQVTLHLLRAPERRVAGDVLGRLRRR